MGWGTFILTVCYKYLKPEMAQYQLYKKSFSFFTILAKYLQSSFSFFLLYTELYFIQSCWFESTCDRMLYRQWKASYTRRLPVQGTGQISFILQLPMAYLDQDFIYYISFSKFYRWSYGIYKWIRPIRNYFINFGNFDLTGLIEVSKIWEIFCILIP